MTSTLLARWDDLDGEYSSWAALAATGETSVLWTPSGAQLNDPVPGHSELGGERPVTKRLQKPPEWLGDAERYGFDADDRLLSSTWFHGDESVAHEEFFLWQGDERESVWFKRDPGGPPHLLCVTYARYGQEGLEKYCKWWDAGERAEWFEVSYDMGRAQAVTWSDIGGTGRGEQHVSVIDYSYGARGQLKLLRDRSTGEKLYGR